MLQFSIQFAHAFENHKHNACPDQHETHFGTHKNDCDVFHYKINHVSYKITSFLLDDEQVVLKENIFGAPNFTQTFNVHFKLGRSPPAYC